MNPIIFIVDYMQWHYSRAFRDILRVWGNLLWFILHISSFFELLKTLFAPWKRIHEEKPPKGTFDPGYYAGSILVNIIMRFVGFLTRGAILFLASSVFIATSFVGVAFFLFWLIAPLAVPLIFISGLAMLA
jgi:hypothetical protein